MRMNLFHCRFPLNSLVLLKESLFPPSLERELHLLFHRLQSLSHHSLPLRMEERGAEEEGDGIIMEEEDTVEKTEESMDMDREMKIEVKEDMGIELIEEEDQSMEEEEAQVM